VRAKATVSEVLMLWGRYQPTVPVPCTVSLVLPNWPLPDSADKQNHCVGRHIKQLVWYN